MDCPPVPPRYELIWAAIDLDGTLAATVWSPGSTTIPIGPPIPENIAKLQALVDQGRKIIIHTARPWSDYEAIEHWLNWHGIPWSRIVCGKVLAGIYVDDRGVHASEDEWTVDYGCSA